MKDHGGVQRLFTVTPNSHQQHRRINGRAGIQRLVEALRPFQDSDKVGIEALQSSTLTSGPGRVSAPKRRVIYRTPTIMLPNLGIIQIDLNWFEAEVEIKQAS